MRTPSTRDLLRVLTFRLANPRPSRTRRRTCGLVGVEPLEPRQLLAADLTGSFGDLAPLTLAQGTSQAVTVTLDNAGDAEAAPAGGFTVNVFASADGVLDESDRQLGTATQTAAIAAGGTVDLPVTLSVPADLAAGSYTLIASVD